MYIHRNLEEKFLRASKFFKAVLVTGARQVGKTNPDFSPLHIVFISTFSATDNAANFPTPFRPIFMRPFGVLASSSTIFFPVKATGVGSSSGVKKIVFASLKA